MEWESGFTIAVRLEGGAAVISANREGLLSLAKLMNELAGETPGSHAHLDQYNGLEDGSTELIVEKTE